MAKILCSISGIEFTCQHFPVYLTRGESHHPIFDVSPQKLFKYRTKWESGELTETDSYLLFIALLKSTELVDFDYPCKRVENTPQLIASNMDAMWWIAGKILDIHHPRLVFPKIRITPDTASLENVKYWIQLWENTFQDFANGLKEQELKEKLSRREAALERLIKNEAIKPIKYAHILAAWANEAAAFPEFEMVNPVSLETTTCSQYWMDIIQASYLNEKIISYPQKDVEELLTHCEDNIELGSIYSYQLLTTLRSGLDTIKNFFGINIFTRFSILDGDSNTEDIEIENVKLMAADAPSSKPERKDYPNELAFLKAKVKWEMASRIQNTGNGE